MIENLDFICAKYGEKLTEVTSDENLLRKSLGVLQEDGLYAFVIYLEKEKNNIKEAIEKFLEEGKVLKENEDLKNQEIYTNLHRLLMTKSVIEKMLIYAIYHIKAGESK